MAARKTLVKRLAALGWTETTEAGKGFTVWVRGERRLAVPTGAIINRDVFRFILSLAL